MALSVEGNARARRDERSSMGRRRRWGSTETSSRAKTRAREDEKSIAASRSAASERASVKQEALGASVGQSSRIG